MTFVCVGGITAATLALPTQTVGAGLFMVPPLFGHFLSHWMTFRHIPLRDVATQRDKQKIAGLVQVATVDPHHNHVRPSATPIKTRVHLLGHTLIGVPATALAVGPPCPLG